MPNVHLSDGLVDILAVKKEGGNHLQLIKASYKQFLATGNNSDEVSATAASDRRRFPHCRVCLQCLASVCVCLPLVALPVCRACL